MRVHYRLAACITGMAMLSGCGNVPLAGPGPGGVTGNYEAGAHHYTEDGRPIICDTAGPVARSLTRCY